MISGGAEASRFPNKEWIAPQTKPNNSPPAATCVLGTLATRNRHVSDRHIRRLFRHINNHRCPGMVRREGGFGGDPRRRNEEQSTPDQEQRRVNSLTVTVKRSKNYQEPHLLHFSCAPERCRGVWTLVRIQGHGTQNTQCLTKNSEISDS